MIDFRYHLVSIVAVFLALAVGIVLGSTELQGDTVGLLRTANDSLNSQYEAARSQRDAYAAQAGAADQFLQTSESVLLGDGKLLAGRKIVLITEPTAPDSVISGVKKAATAAGAVVTGQVALATSFNDLSGTTQATLSTINGSIAASQGTTLAPATDSQTGNQQGAAQLIASAVVQQAPRPGTAPAPGLSTADAQTLLRAYAQAGFITVTGAVTSRASLAVIVTPGSAPAGSGSDPVGQVLVAVAQQFAAASDATVVAGATAVSAMSGSPISVVRAGSVSSQVSTVDNADTTQGQITVMQAFARQLTGGKPGSYGLSGASAVSPQPVPTPVPTAAGTPATSPSAAPKPRTSTPAGQK